MPKRSAATAAKPPPDPRRTLVERLFAAWCEAPHLTFGALLGRALGVRLPGSDPELVDAVEAYARGSTLGPPPSPGLPDDGGPCPHHPPVESLPQVVCYACGAWKPTDASALHYVKFIHGVRTGWKGKGDAWTGK